MTGLASTVPAAVGASKTRARKRKPDKEKVRVGFEVDVVLRRSKRRRR